MATATLSEVMVPASKSLAGKVAFVTGASRGIGRAIALELAKSGSNGSHQLSIERYASGEVRDEIEHMGGVSEIFQGDISDRFEARSVDPGCAWHLRDESTFW